MALYSSFPDPNLSEDDGLLAVGGDLSPERLLEAYHMGIFPWYNADDPILWWSPNPRMVLYPEKLRISKSMKQLFKKQAFTVTFNRAFREVMENCADIDRPGQNGTWIVLDMIDAYCRLHDLGYAQSVEVWQEEQLVGGLYGVYLPEKRLFCGESMFAKVSNASKYGFITWVQFLLSKGVELIDCQVYSKHLESLGAQEIPRVDFLRFLQQ